MSYTVTQESFSSLTSYWKNPECNLKWDSVFVLPAWLEVWWREFEPRSELYLGVVRQQDDIIGIAPLQVTDGRAAFIGDTDVCDYMDFIVAPGREEELFAAVLDDLKKKGVSRLELEHVRPDSSVVTHLAEVAKGRGYAVDCRQAAVSFEMSLPPTWDEYLERLEAKQRHELRRKLRRISGAGQAAYRCVDGDGDPDALMASFLKLFALSREEKARFMNARMEGFFRKLAMAMAGIGLLRFGVLEMNALPVAMIMGFDYNDTVYLYNSAYDPAYTSLSVGLLSKAFGIRESIQSGRNKWDFLKGDEAYKRHIGGTEVPLYSCRITLG
ncbi:MAG: GNAT family N-acetyltransferase [Chloroflexota bacterium]